ncbi:MAG: hypothetical protein MJ230_04640 [bacterium]|nr:hypothetical protein [bacterium]
MYLKLIEILFGVFAFILTLLMILREFGITKNLSPMKASDYVSSMAGFMFAYILFSFILATFIPGGINKIVLALFGFSPFIIGKLVTYQKVKTYSFLQILCVILSIVFVYAI